MNFLLPLPKQCHESLFISCSSLRLNLQFMLNGPLFFVSPHAELLLIPTETCTCGCFMRHSFETSDEQASLVVL